ncbi:ComEA family DNA-binding protein [Microbacterium sp. No. 7]|uniref:ComEA family DNA-binding protein n=1 Tax=Microbacterium sp. No. 7 TaxID=1714373 RepID=UPI0006D27D40|nr:ComEA family DNA-binding protein [Microbacterium sp. No. 7]ALJ20526.1 competence protein ComEA [Microbacterium sp. No. 7]
MDPVDPPPAPRPRRTVGLGAAIVLVLAAAAATVAIGVVRTASAPAEEVVAVEIRATAAPVYVHVHGQVVSPGLYRLDEGARVVDVVAAAGGMTDAADAAAVNLARALSDGEQLYVPAVGEVPPPSAAAAGEADGRVNLNTADAAALDTLPRVGPAIAARIIQWRDENGPFTSVEDLLAVSGIGEKMLEGLRDLVVL